MAKSSVILYAKHYADNDYEMTTMQLLGRGSENYQKVH